MQMANPPLRFFLAINQLTKGRVNSNNNLQKVKRMTHEVPKISENDLKEMINCIEGSKTSADRGNEVDKVKLVGPPGFEPESRESKSQSLDQASRRPLFCENRETTRYCNLVS